LIVEEEHNKYNNYRNDQISEGSDASECDGASDGSLTQDESYIDI
jgi:hypothetical protein